MVSSSDLHLLRPRKLITLGTIESSALVAPLLQTALPDSPSKRHFSSFPMTSHLHNPVLRLVSLNPELAFTVSFLRVPEIHDGYEYKIYLHPSMTVKQVVDLVIEELGLAKSLPVPGGGALEYVLEETWIDGQQDRNYIPMCFFPYIKLTHTQAGRVSHRRLLC